MFVLFFSFLIFLFLMNLFHFNYFYLMTRLSLMTKLVCSFMKNLLNTNVCFMILFFLFFSLFVFNILGNIPLFPICTMYYSFTVTISLLFWLSIMSCVAYTQFYSFLAHMMPYGAPMMLGLFLPLVEIFSQIIRPFTLMIRLSTNLSSGHIMMLMFSYFTTLSSLVSPLIFVVLSLLLILEMMLSMLQAYIFVSLLTLYLSETI